MITVPIYSCITSAAAARERSLLLIVVMGGKDACCNESLVWMRINPGKYMGPVAVANSGVVDATAGVGGASE